MKNFNKQTVTFLDLKGYNNATMFWEDSNHALELYYCQI